MIDPLGPLVVTQRSAEITIGTLALYQKGYSWNESSKLVAQAFDQVDANIDRMRTLRPADGIQELLFNLKRRGFSLALATSDERRDTEAMLSSLCMEGIFDKVLCAGEVNSPKPNAESILAICRQLSIDPKETIFVGDSMADMIMGKNAGIALTIGVLQSGVTPREELEKAADIVIDSFGELKSY